MEDLIDDDVRRGLKTLLDYEGDDTEDIFCLNFEVTWMVLGQEQKKELKPGGSDIAVTFENKEEYVMLYVKWLLVDSIGPQYSEFERGFMKVMVDSSLEILLAEEVRFDILHSIRLLVLSNKLYLTVRHHVRSNFFP